MLEVRGLHGVKSHLLKMAEIDGERLLKTYYIDENGDHWLVPANPKFRSIKLDGSTRVRFWGKLKHHLRSGIERTVGVDRLRTGTGAATGVPTYSDSPLFS